METPPVPVEQNLLDIFAHIEVADDEDDRARREASRLAAMPATYSTAVLSPTMKTLTPAWGHHHRGPVQGLSLHRTGGLKFRLPHCC